MWLDGSWFVSSEPFDAVSGFLSESADGGYPSSAGDEATVDGTITCN